MPVNPKFLQARATEQLNRVLAHLPHPPMLRVVLLPATGFFARCFSSRAVYCPIVHLTERHRLELLATGNAFLSSLAPLLGDVQKFLWRLHPLFIRPDGELPNQRTPGGPRIFATPAQSAQSRREVARLARHLRRADLFEAERTIRTYILATEQDMTQPADPTATPSNQRRGRACPEPNYFDDYLEACQQVFGWDRDTALDQPRALVRQRIRARILQQPDGYMRLPPSPSDAFLAAPDLPAPSSQLPAAV